MKSFDLYGFPKSFKMNRSHYNPVKENRETREVAVKIIERKIPKQYTEYSKTKLAMIAGRWCKRK